MSKKIGDPQNTISNMGVNPKIVVIAPKMDKLYNGSNPYEQMDDLGG